MKSCQLLSPSHDSMEYMNIMMKLQSAPFTAIKSGTKDIELRLNDEKRQKLQIGDIITFSKLPEETETVTTEIVGLLRYATFADLVEDFSPKRMGGTDKLSIVEGMIRYYSREEQEEYGVLGIKLRLVKD